MTATTYRTKCPICKTRAASTPTGKYLECANCHTVFTQHYPKALTIKKSNDKYFRKNISNTIEEKIISIQKERLHRILDIQPNAKRFLDIGPGQGIFLKCVKEAKRKPYAIDISQTVLQFLSTQGIRTFTRFSQMKNLHFDCISAFDVIEHTTNPHVFIKHIKMKLNPKEGFVIITTPNANGISAKLLKNKWWVFDPEGHYILFTVTSLTYLLRQYGFNIQNVSTDIITQWFIPNDSMIKKIANKCIYLLFLPFNTLLFKNNLGDNIEIIAKL